MSAMDDVCWKYVFHTVWGSFSPPDRGSLLSMAVGGLWGGVGGPCGRGEGRWVGVVVDELYYYGGLMMSWCR